MFGDCKVQKQQHQGDNKNISFPRPDGVESDTESLTETRTLDDIKNKNILEDRRPPRMNATGMGATNSSDIAHPSGVGIWCYKYDASMWATHEDGYILRIPDTYLVER